MNVRLYALACWICCALVHAEAASVTAPAPIVFFDIAGPDTGKLSAFYREVFGWTIGADGRVEAPVAVSASTSLSGTLRNDPKEALLYFGVADVTATLQKIVANGGSIDAPRFEVKGVVILGLFRDPAGNRMGLVEMNGARAKVP